MKNREIKLFAIFKKGTHLGNQKGKDADDAIKKYLIAAFYGDCSDDLDFLSLYRGKKAIKNIHF